MWIAVNGVILNSKITEGDSIYFERGPSEAFEYFSQLAVSTDDTLFNDVVSRINYFAKLKELGHWGDSVAEIDKNPDQAACDRYLSQNPPAEVLALLYAKKAALLFDEGLEVQSAGFYIDSGSPGNMLKAAVILLDADHYKAKEIFLEIVREYPYTLEADVSRVYLEGMN